MCVLWCWFGRGGTASLLSAERSSAVPPGRALYARNGRMSFRSWLNESSFSFAWASRTATRTTTRSIVSETRPPNTSKCTSPTPRFSPNQRFPRQQFAAHPRLDGRVVRRFQDEDPVDFLDCHVRVVRMQAEAPFAGGEPGVDFFEGVLAG